MRALTSFLLAWLVVVAMALPSYAEKRVALVVGNSDYEKVARLANPASDATAVAGLLSRLGFSVSAARIDLGAAAFKRALSDFEVDARGADIAIVYYSGHGIQVGGVDYFVPVDANLARDVDVEDEAIPVERAARAVSGATRLGLVVLDACRDNPFLPKVRITGATRGITRGLAPIAAEASSNLLVAFSAAPGEEAVDGPPNGHSPFTQALLQRLATPGLDVQLALRRVRDDVSVATGGKQKPYMTGTIGGSEIALAPPSGVSAAASEPPPVAPKTPIAATFSDNSVCFGALNSLRDGWDLSATASSYVDEANRRHFAVADCRRILGVVDRPPSGSGAEKPVLVGTYGDWSVYHGRLKGNPGCFALASPKTRDPSDFARASAYAFVSQRPAEGVRNEVSFITGYEVAATSASAAAPKATIGNREFALLPRGANLWVKNPAEEGVLIDEMRGAERIEISAASRKGTVVVDTYSLIGFKQAIERAQKDCPPS